MLRGRLLVLLPVAVAIAVYANTLGAGFVYDDRLQILDNPWVQELRHFPRVVTSPVWAFWTTDPTNYFRPLQMGLYNLLWNAFGGAAFPFHLLNILLHAFCTGALFDLVRRLSRGRVVPLVASLLFAVHPVHTEAVAWIAALPELTFCGFSLLAMLWHLEGREAPTGAARRRWRVLAGVAFTLALLSKETAAVFVPLIAATEWLVDRQRSVGRSARAALPYGMILAGYLALRLVAFGAVAPLQAPGRTMIDAVLNAPWLLLGYLRILLWPWPLLVYHVPDPVVDFVDPRFWAALLGVGALALGLARLARRRADVGIAGLLILLPLLPVLYLPALGATIFSERYAYLPSAGAVWILAAGFGAAWRARPSRAARSLAVVSLVAVLLAAGGITVRRNADWHDDGRLATATLEREPRARVWAMLARWHKDEGQPERALAVYEQAMQRFPDDVTLRADWINQQMRTRRISPDEAVRELQRLAGEQAGLHGIFVLLGNAYMQVGDAASAERAFLRSMELNPTNKPARDGLRLARIAQGEQDRPSNVESDGGFRGGVTPLDLLIEGAAHLEAGRLDDAERKIHAALEADPNYAPAWLSLGVLAARRSDHPAAVEFCRRATELDPGLIDAHQQLGTSALRVGDPVTAVSALERAAELAPHDKEALNRLGVAYIRAGRREEAHRAWTRALEIDPGFAKARHNLERLTATP